MLNPLLKCNWLKKFRNDLIYMPQGNYIRNLLNIKDQNLIFDEDGIHDEFIKDKTCKIIDAYFFIFQPLVINVVVLLNLLMIMKKRFR